MSAASTTARRSTSTPATSIRDRTSAGSTVTGTSPAFHPRGGFCSTTANLTTSRRRRRDFRPGDLCDSYHDLSKMLIGTHEGERVGDVVQLVDFVDRQRQLASFERRPQVGAHQADDLADFVERTGAEGHADIIDTLERVKVEI